MRVIDTLKLGYADPVRRLSGVFDALARNRDADVGELLWGQLKPSRPHPQRSVPLMRVSRFAARNEPRNRLTHYRGL